MSNIIMETVRKSVEYGDNNDKEDEDQTPNEQAAGGMSMRKEKFDSEEEEDSDYETRMKLREELIPRETTSKLKKLCIILKHEVPPQHQVETCAGTRSPTSEQKAIMEQFCPIKYGKFIPEEDKIIVNNWKSFCEMHDWDPENVKPFLCMRYHGMKHVGLLTKLRQRQKFVQFLADGISWRTLNSVYSRFKNLYRQPHLRSKYTKGDDEMIMALLKDNSDAEPKNYKAVPELAEILRRTRDSVRRRFKLLKKKGNLHRS